MAEGAAAFRHDFGINKSYRSCRVAERISVITLQSWLA